MNVVTPLNKGMSVDSDRPLHISMARAIGHDHSATRPHHLDPPGSAGSVDNRGAAVRPNHRRMARRRKARGTAIGAMELGPGSDVIPNLRSAGLIPNRRPARLIPNLRSEK